MHALISTNLKKKRFRKKTWIQFYLTPSLEFSAIKSLTFYIHLISPPGSKVTAFIWDSAVEILQATED